MGDHPYKKQQMTVTRSDGTSLYTGTPLEGEHTKHRSVNVDQGAVHIDAGDPDHVIRIKHDRNDGVDILTAIDNVSGTKTAHLDSAGGMHCPNLLYGSNPERNVGTDINLLVTNIDLIETDITALEAVTSGIEIVVDAATATDDGATDNLVKRAQALGTEIDNLHVVASATNYTATWPPAGLFFTTGTTTESLDLLANAQLKYQPYTAGGSPITSRTFAFGRATPLLGETIAQADVKRDGLLIQDDAVDHSCEIMCSNELPTLRLVGTKDTSTSGGFTEPVCPVIEVQDGSGQVNYAVYDDGFVVQKGHQDTDPDALNSGHWSSGVFAAQSGVIGSARLSYDRAAKKLTLMRLKTAIPVYLGSKGMVAGDVSAAYDQMSVHAWVALGRTFLSNERLAVGDVFPSTNADWEAVPLDTDSLITNAIRPAIGIALRMIRARAGLFADSSVWLGDKLHVNARSSRAQLQIRKDTIPAYLAAAPYNVDVADVQALGVTVATATLDHWITLSENAGGSDELSVIFPVANQSADFELRTTLNELLVQPQDQTGDGGITINQPTGGHPCLFFEGDSAVGNGYGLIQFAD